MYISTVPSTRIFLNAFRTAVARRRARLVLVRCRVSDLEFVTRLVAQGRLRPVIDRAFPLEEIQAAAKHLETKRARGKIVVRIQTRDASSCSP